MPTIDAIVIAAIVLAFILFGAVLAWADHQTRHLRQSDRRMVAAAAAKAKATVVQLPPAKRAA